MGEFFHGKYLITQLSIREITQSISIYHEIFIKFIVFLKWIKIRHVQKHAEAWAKAGALLYFVLFKKGRLAGERHVGNSGRRINCYTLNSSNGVLCKMIAY